MKISMRLFFLICIVALFAQTATVLNAQEPQKEVPVAVIPEPDYVFPPVPEATEVLHDYTVQNKGAGPLIIEQIKTG